MRKVMVDLPRGYTIRFAKYEDIAEIMDFFDKHWKRGHILARDRNYFEYEFYRHDEVSEYPHRRNAYKGVSGEMSGTLKDAL